MTTSPDLRPALAPFPPTLSITTPGIPPPLAFSVTPNGLSTVIKISPCTAFVATRVLRRIGVVVVVDFTLSPRKEEEERRPAVDGLLIVGKLCIVIILERLCASFLRAEKWEEVAKGKEKLT